MLRKAAREDWTADDLLRAQARVVHDKHVAMYGNTISEVEGGSEYVRAELWRQNAVVTAQDPELQQLYNRATTAAEDAAARAAQTPALARLDDAQLQRADNISAMAPDTLRQQVMQGLHRLGENERGLVRSAVVEMQLILESMARAFIEGRPDNIGRVFRTGSELIAAQRQVMRAHALERHLSQEGIGLANLEIVRLNDELVTRTLEASHAAGRRAATPPPSPRAQATNRSAELRPDQATRLEYNAEQAMTALPPEGRQILGQLMITSGDELREMTRRFLVQDNVGSGAAATVEELLENQIAVLRRNISATGLEVPEEVADAAEAAIMAELRRYNATAALEARRALPAGAIDTPDAPFSSRSLPPAGRDSGLLRRAQEAADALGRDGRIIADPDQLADELGEAMSGDFPDGDIERMSELIYEHADDLMRRASGRNSSGGGEIVRGMSPPPANERSFEAFLPRGRSTEAGSITNRTHEAFDALMASGTDAREINQIYRAFSSAHDEIRTMLRSFVADEPHITAGGGRRLELGSREELIRQQLNVVREHVASEFGVPVNTNFGAQFDEAIALELERVNGNVASELHYGGVMTQRADRNLARREARRTAEEAGQLKNPDPEIDERPATIDGLPTDAAVRLDDALQPEMERLQTLYGERQVNADDAMLAESLPDIEEQARAFARDNPGLISEEDALGYARRRHSELGTVDADDWLYDGGFARSELLPPLEDDAIFENLEQTVMELADNGDTNTWDNVESNLRAAGVNDREMRRAERVWNDREADLDGVWEQRQAPPSSAEPPSSGGSSGSMNRYGDIEPEDAGLPDMDTLRDAGMRSVHIHSDSGIERVFGRDLTIEEVRGIFSLDHLKKYAGDKGLALQTNLEVGDRYIEFNGRVGRDFSVQTTYRQGSNGLEVYYNFLHIPQEMEGTGVAKKLIGDMVKPLEDLGCDHVTLSAAWIGQYAWPKLGARPSREAELMAFDAFEQGLRAAVDPAMADATAQHVMGKIDSLRDLADTWLPADMVKDRLPELRQGWEELMESYRHSNVKTMTFEEACMRTSRSGNEQFLAGKYFLLKQTGDWNSGLRLDIAPGTPWYDEFKGRLGLTAAVGAIGLGMWELAGAFTGTELVASGIGSPREEGGDEEMPPEVAKYMEEQEARDEKVEGVREKLGYVKSQSQTAMQTAARSLASPLARDRSVATVPGVTSSQGVARFIGRNDSLREAYEEKRETLEKMARDPMALVEELTEGLAEMEETAPALHEKMVAQTYKIVQFLQSKLPSTIGTSLARPKGAPPNEMALRQFALYYSAATEPGTVLADLSNNRARREQVDTLREVWPEAYTQLKTGIVAEMAKGRPTVAQRQRLDLLFDFGDSLDTALSSRLMALAGQLENEKVAGKGEDAAGGAPGKVPQRRTQPSVAGAGAANSLAQGPAGGGALA
jgi:hypothetical protein